ncbi:Fe(3+) dicitrate ABC transporter permease subunit FecD [Gynuella sp.]|uniref:Fe(3+) dicitrate ABC transporter permease subunit FecD n=1 Tax=Gynuella sp. TaxID=2969146 RepID=UPI003D14676A
MNSAVFRLLTLVLLVLLMMLLNLVLGAVDLSWSQLWNGLHSDSEYFFTVHEYRLPRIFLALVAGAMLALAGTLVQGVIRNPLASPDILGVSQGAGLAAVIMMTLWPQLSVMWLPWVALSGGLLAAGLLWLICGHKTPPVKFAITGVALSACCASGIDFLMLTRPMEINNALLWLTGSLWGRGWSQLAQVAPWLVLLLPAVWLAHRLNLIGLGDDNAVGLGVNVALVRAMALAIAIGLTSAVVSVCGPISFLGLVAPHLARQLTSGRHQQLIPAAILTGALLLLVADLAARTIAPPIELPAGIMTAILGAPYFLWLLFKVK